MKSNTYGESLEAAKSEMAELLEQQKTIASRISKLAPVIEYLSALCDELPSLPPNLQMSSSFEVSGLSDAIRMAFKGAIPKSLTPTEVRDRLREAGFRLDRYKNELPPIHNTIARLKDQGEIEEVIRVGGEKACKWVSSLKRALLELEQTPTPIVSSTFRGRPRDLVGQIEQGPPPPPGLRKGKLSDLK